MKRIEGMSVEARIKFLKNYKREDKIDDSTFNMWKSELQKELPSFWQSMSDLK